MWHPSIAPMTPLRPQRQWKAAADAAFSQVFGQDIKDDPIVHMMLRACRMILCAVDCDTSNLSDISRKLFWLAMYHRNISTFFVGGTGGRPWLCGFWIPLSCSFIMTYSNWGLVTRKWREKVWSSMFSIISHSVPVFNIIRCVDCSTANILGERQNVF